MLADSGVSSVMFLLDFASALHIIDHSILINYRLQGVVRFVWGTTGPSV